MGTGIVGRIVGALVSLVLVTGGMPLPGPLGGGTDGLLRSAVMALLGESGGGAAQAAPAVEEPGAAARARQRERREARERRRQERRERERREARERQRQERRERERREARQRAVRQAQGRLAELGFYAGALDGIAGPRTERAVSAFQRVAGLTVDGALGERTLRALRAPDAPARPVQRVIQRTVRSPSTVVTSCDHVCWGKRVWRTVPVPLPSGWSIDFEPGRAGYLGMTYPASRRIVVWMREAKSDGFMRHVMLHEIAHAVDVDRLPDAEEGQWMSRRGLSGPWYDCPGGGCGDLATPAGDWAEAYGWCHGSGVFESEIGRTPTDGDCRLLRSLAR